MCVLTKDGPNEMGMQGCLGSARCIIEIENVIWKAPHMGQYLPNEALDNLEIGSSL